MKFRWHVWTERFKTALLALLVTSSLVLSGLIWTGTPTKVAVGSTGFYSNPLYGSERTTDKFIEPRAIWLWTSNQELYRIGGASTAARAILKGLRTARLLSYRLVAQNSYEATVPDKTPYLSLDYNGLLQSASLWRLALPITGMPANYPAQNGITLFPKGPNNQYQLMFGTRQRVFVGVLQLSAHFRKWLTPGTQAVPFAQLPVGDSEMLLPYTPMDMKVYFWILNQPNTTQVIDSFFVDPSLVQSIRKTAKDTVYSDGTESVTLEAGSFGSQLAYRRPSGILSGYRESAYSALQTAVPFINNRGGFAGNQSLTSAVATAAGVDLTFQDSVGGWPFFSQIDQIRVQVQNGMVTGLWHTLSYHGGETTMKVERILSGTQLLALLDNSELQGLSGISLGYGTQALNNETMMLIPVYQLLYQDKPPLYLDAQTGKTMVGGM